MPKLDTHNVDVVAGAIYFVVGRGTEGGPASYHLTIAGVTSGTTDPFWGDVKHVQSDSGYSLGAIQVDLGKRGTWALGSAKEAAPKPGERSYVDAIIEESARYAKDHHLKYAQDKVGLRADLLTHGHGQRASSTLKFIETDTRDSINAWASSASGRPWIHKNIDYPQIRQATKSAMDLLDKFGKNVPDEHRLEAIAILAKTENQLPAKMKAFEKVLKDGGDYDDLLTEAKQIKKDYGSYDGLKAGNLAGKYVAAYEDPETAAALDRAQAKVASADFNPSIADADIDDALSVIGQGPAPLRRGSRGDEVAAVQADLAKLGFTDDHGVILTVDGKFGSGTQAAVRAFQDAHGLTVDGRVGPRTLRLLHEAAGQRVSSLADASHPGNAMFCQALERVHAIDAQHGRSPDVFSNNFAGALAAAAHAQGLARIDHVLMGSSATRAFAVQGDPGSPFRQFASVDVLQAVATPLEQSSATFQASASSMSQQASQPLQDLAQSPLPGIQR